MPKKLYTGSYRKRATSGTGKGGSAGIGAMMPPIQSDANQIAAPVGKGKDPVGAGPVGGAVRRMASSGGMATRPDAKAYSKQYWKGNK